MLVCLPLMQMENGKYVPASRTNCRSGCSICWLNVSSVLCLETTRNANCLFVLIGPLFDTLDFNTAFTSEAAIAALPARLMQDIPVVGFEYGEPLGLKWCNHARLAKNLTAAQCCRILQSRCPCEKHKHEFVGKGLIPPGCNHVVTCSPDILGDVCP